MKKVIIPEVVEDCAKADCIVAIYNKLEPKIINSLLKEYNAGRITGEQYAMVFSQVLIALMQIASQYPLTYAQIELANAQTKETLELIPSKKIFLEKQVEAEENKGLLLLRQAQALDDNLRIQQAEIMSKMVGMIFAGATDVSSSIWNDVRTRIDAIVPK